MAETIETATNADPAAATCLEAESARVLLARYEAAQTALGERNLALCARGSELEVAMRSAADHCSACAAGFQHLQAELQLVPACAAELKQTAAHAAALGGQFEALETKLDQLAVAQVRASEVRWRRQQMEQAELAQAKRKQELQQLRERMAADAAREIAEAQAERQQVFQEQFEAEKAFALKHSADNLRRQPAQAQAPTASLAEMQPAAGAADLDDFFAD